jgi:hypothetical protein
MDILVECHSGYTYPEYPLAVTMEGVRNEVKLVASEWQSRNGLKHFTVILEDDRPITIAYNYLTDTWQLEFIGNNQAPTND